MIARGPTQLETRAPDREFAEAECRPPATRWDEHRELDPDVFDLMAGLAFTGMLIPERYGGPEPYPHGHQAASDEVGERTSNSLR